MTAKEIKQDIADLKLAIKSPATPEDKKTLFENKVKELEEKLKAMESKPEPKAEKKDDDDFYTAVSKKTGATSKITKDKIEPVAKKNPSGKIALKEIEILWAEGNQSNYPKFPQKYTSYSEANNRAIRPVYADFKKSGGGGYNKVKFKVYWVDGEDYEGRLDVSENEDNPTKSNNVIGQHIYAYLKWAISDKSQWSAQEKNEAKDFLNNYDLGILIKAVKTETKETPEKPKEDKKSVAPSQPKQEAPERKKSVPLKKSEIKDLDYDKICDELIEKEKQRRAKAKERAKLPKKTEATKIKDRLGEIGDRIEDGAEEGKLSRAELIKLISECKALLKVLEQELAKLK